MEVQENGPPPLTVQLSKSPSLLASQRKARQFKTLLKWLSLTQGLWKEFGALRWKYHSRKGGKCVHVCVYTCVNEANTTQWLISPGRLESLRFWTFAKVFRHPWSTGHLTGVSIIETKVQRVTLIPPRVSQYSYLTPSPPSPCLEMSYIPQHCLAYFMGPLSPNMLTTLAGGSFLMNQVGFYLIRVYLQGRLESKIRPHFV